MKIDWEGFLKREFKNAKVINGRNGTEYQIDCISPDCPNPKGHMFVNAGSDNRKHDKRFMCHRCGFSGNYKAFLVTYYKMSFEKIIENFDILIHGDYDLISVITEYSKEKQIDLKIEEDDEEEGFVIDLPKSYKRLTYADAFCKRRKIPIHLIFKLRIGMCDSGFFENRIIFPIETKNNSSFVAYNRLTPFIQKFYKRLYKKTNNKKFYLKSCKTLNPSSTAKSMLLYGYNHINEGEHLVLVVEGITDVIRCMVHGYYAVGKLGSFVSLDQAFLLGEKNPKEICYLPDSDVSEERILTNLKTLKECCDGNVTLATIKKGDPDDIKDKKEFDKIINNRKLIKGKSLKHENLTIF